MALSASLAEPPPPQHQLYSLEVYCHGLRDLEGVATSTNPCLAFRLWDFPTLFIRPDLQNKEGHRRGTEAKDGCFRSICFESGRSCLFQVRPAELACRLPLMLHVLLLDEESETERTVLGSHALVIGEENDSLRCSISRGVFSLADVLGRKVGAMTIDVRLTCLGDSNIPRKLTQSAPAGGALLPGQHSPIGAVVGGGGLQARMMHAASTSNDWHRVNRLLGPPPAAAGGRPVVGGFDDNYPSSSIAGVPSFFRQSSKSHTSKRGRKRPKGSSSRHRNYDEDASVTYSDDLMAPVKSQSGVAKRFQYESMRKYLRYEVLAQLATITALVEEYVASDRRLGRLQEYALDEQDFLLQEVGLIKNLSHNTNKVLSAVDQYCHAQHGVSALGVPAPSRSYTPGRRTRSRDRAAAAAHHHHRRRPSADGSESSSSGAQRSRSGKRAHPTGKTRRRSRSDDETREKREKRDDLDSKKHDASSDAKEKAALAQAQEDKRQAAEGAESERARQKDKEELDRLQAALDKKKLALEDGIKEKEAGEARRLQGEAEKAVADAKQAQLKAELALQEAQNQEAKLQAQKAAPADREEAVHDEFEDADKAAAANQQSKAKAQAESDSEAKLKAQAEAAAKQQPGEAKEKAPAWKVGQRARVRDTEKESWKKGTVTKLDGDRPLVRVDGQDPAFHWNFVEAVEDDMPAFTAGERVKVRDTAKEEWKRGVVTTVAGGKVSVRLEGQQRAFTWNFVAADKPQFKPGDRVRARDKAADPWAAGTVESADSTNTTVRLDGAKQAFTWAHVEPLPKDEEPELKKEPTGVAKEDFSIGDRVRVRDTEHEEWRKGVVTSKANGVTSVLVEGLQKEFSWNLIERDAAAAAVAAPAGHAVGDRVRVRDTAKEDWRAGTVANATGANVTVKLDGQDRAFTWNHVEKDAPPSKQQYSVGDRVRVRDTAKQDWRSGTVATVTADNVTVRLDGQDRPFTWSFVEPLPTSPSAKGKTKVSSPTAKQKAALSVGARVRVRDTEVEVWHKGAVESITNGRPVVKVDGQKKAFTWNFVEPLPDEKPTSDTSAKDQFAVGERVKVRDTAKQDWTRGTVESVASGRVTVRPDGQQRAFTWTFVEKDAHVEGGSPPGPAGFRVGDKVKVRDSEKQPWNKGVVEKVSGAKPVVRVNGQPRAFTWMFCERDDDAAAAGAAFAKGDRVRVRDRPNDLWRNGTVESMSGAKPLVSIDGGGVHALSWSFVEKLDEKGGKESTSSEYNVGDRVLVRDAATDNWKKARIESVSPQVTAKVDGAARAFSWNQIAKDTTNQLAPGKRVRFRDSEREDWKRGVVDSMNAKGLPVVRGDGQTRAFTWNFVELDDEAPDPAVVKEAGYRVGDRLSVKDTANAPWRSGVVESIADGIPKIRVDGASMAFTWNYVAKNPANTAAVNFSVGDKVRVRDNPQDDWKSGVVKSAGPKPMVQVATGTFTWRFVEPDTSSRTPAIASSSSSSQFGRDPPAKEPTYKIGERVLVRDSDRDPWKRGAVVSAGGSKPTVKVDGSDRSFTWNSYKRDEGAPAPGSEVVEKFRAGETVLVRDTDKESWKEGVVESAFGSRPTVKLVGQSRAFTWGQVKKGPDTWVVGDRVRVRDHVSEDWKDGVVDDVPASVIKVKVGNQRAFSWNFIERRP